MNALKRISISTEYLIELNQTGTLPNEIDETSNVSEFDGTCLLVDVANFFFSMPFKIREMWKIANEIRTGQCIKMWISFGVFH